MAQIGSHFIVLGPRRKLVPNQIVSVEDTRRPAAKRPAPAAPAADAPVTFGRRGTLARETQLRKSAGGFMGIFGFGRRESQSRSRGR